MQHTDDHDPPPGLRDETDLGEWLHTELVIAYGLETEDWALERVRRVQDKLNGERWGGPPLQVEILWLQTMTAFVAPGRYVYLSRELLQRADGDDPIAFVLAHEMAHHDLGHTRLFDGWLSRLRTLPVPGGLTIAALVRTLERELFGPEREIAADRYGFNLALVAGYDPVRCAGLFDTLEAHALDHGDLDIVFGPDEAPRHRTAAAESSPLDSLENWIAKARAWNWRRWRGYPSIRERKVALLRHYEDLAAG